MPNQSVQDQFLEPVARLRHLSEVGAAVDVDDNIPPRRYFRSGMEMIRMANVYLDEGNFENAFILYSKFITLFVEKLPHHQDYKQALPTEKANIKRKLNEVFPKAEKLKLYLKDRYSKEFDKYQEEKRYLEEQHMLEKSKQRHDDYEEHRSQKEKQLERKSKLETELEKYKNVAPDDFSAVLGPPLPSDDTFDWSRWSGDESGQGQLPQPSEMAEMPNEFMPTIPSRDLKPNNNLQTNRIYNDIANVPSVDRTTKPSLLNTGSTIQTWTAVRNIIVPAVLMPRFLALAETNTNRNIETCGILTGKLAQNKFTVTHLLVPKQNGTADSCSTDNEEEIFEFQDQHDLITLGWIHTHPSQTSFMSSVDLHTHCAYQLMLPEAIAIVCSPKYNETGIFCLTNDYGLNYIAKCQQTGFHPHPKEPPLYVESQHVHIDSTASINIVDLR